MKSIVDRVPKYPGRRLITPENGSDPFYATIARADEPIVEGTYLNADLLKSLFGAVWYGTCATSGSTSSKVAAISDFSLYVGAIIAVKFSYLNTAVNPTLNVNSSGAKPIYYADAPIKQNTITAGMTALLCYNGSQWVLLNPSESTKMIIGSYAGTGVMGPNNPNVINLPFKPMVFLIGTTNEAIWSKLYFIGDSGTVNGEDGYSGGWVYYTISGGTVSWYCNPTIYNDPLHQANGYRTSFETPCLYTYFAIG